MAGDLQEFQIRVFRKDGELSAYLVLPTWSVAEATEQARLLMSRNLSKAEIWSDGSLLDTITFRPRSSSDPI